jgi:hypothetical protein
MVDVADSGDGFAEKLGLWVHFSDAIALSAVHSESMSGPPRGIRTAMPPERQSVGHVALAAKFDRVQAGLVNSITRSFSTGTGKMHIKLPTPMLELPLDLKAAYAPYGRFYEAHARDMESSIQPLRANVREALAAASPKLRKLAELDGMFEKVLRDRERQLLSKVPALLKKRFDQLFNAHQRKLVESQQSDKPAGWPQTGGWLARFCNDMQTLLMAEMDFRLQPTMGLIEAFNKETRQCEQATQPCN